MTSVQLLLAMSHEACEELATQVAERMTQRDPLDDAELVLRSYGVDGARIKEYRQAMRTLATERAHKLIAKQYPDPGPAKIGLSCPDCNGSGVAEYGWCERCRDTGEVGMANYVQTHKLPVSGPWAERMLRP